MASQRTSKSVATRTKYIPTISNGIAVPQAPPPIPQVRKAISERTRNIINQNQNEIVIKNMGKRKADLSPINPEKSKRCALGNLTNNATIINHEEELQFNNNNNNNNNKHCDKILKKTASNLSSKTATVNLIKTTSSITANNANNKKFKNSKKENSVQHAIDQQQNIVNHEIKQTKVLTRAAARATKLKEENRTTIIKPKEKEVTQKLPTTRRISNEFEKTTDDSLYISALSDLSVESVIGKTRQSTSSLNHKNRKLTSSKQTKATTAAKSTNLIISTSKVSSSETTTTTTTTTTVTSDDTDNSLNISTLTLNSTKYSNLEITEFKTPSSNISPGEEQKNREPPIDIIDFDKENWTDPIQVSHYAMEIFEYLREREATFPIKDYMPKQECLTVWMRTLLIDWMVEVQETFELNHETLYLAVKIVDLYLGEVIIIKDRLQLLGAAALFVACKFDERTPPLVDDFIYICDGAYTQLELIKMEINVFKTIGYDLGIPISYRFLRRYARCAKVPLQILTLGRYILEYSLMEYATIFYSDSKMACAALFMALRMNGKSNVWDKTLQYYTSYQLEDFGHIIPILNDGLQQKPRQNIKTVRSKYSHRIFHEVAKIPLMSTEKLLVNTNILKTINIANSGTSIFSRHK